MSGESGSPVGPVVEGGPAMRPVRAAIEGRFVRLEPLDADAHVVGLYERSHAAPEDDAIWTYMTYGPFDGLDEMRDWLRANAGSTDPLFFTVVEVGSGEPVGVVSLMNIDTEMRRLELGHIWYVRRAQRGRANTESAFLLLRQAFDRWGYRRAEWKCDALNARSRAAAQRLGFTFEGVFRSHMVVKGRNRDTAWFSMLVEEWPARRAAMQRWLDAEPGSVSLGELIAEADGA
ncbi:MAG TPA: GNAT family protein [Actinomycetota bacterium]|jgi:RimJ/RimL family protein N-acetyltransferase|nr:GNAT family protein [Actinomycetota bacterium]